MSSRLRFIVKATSVSAAAMFSASGFAQAFPSKLITIVVPFPPGGLDTYVRLVGTKLSENLHVPVIIENRPGGGSQIAVAALLQKPADGHTLFVGDMGAYAINPYLYPKLQYDPTKDLVPLTRFMTSPHVLVVPTSSKINGLKELLAEAKSTSKGGGLTFATQGVGSGGQMFAESMKSYLGGVAMTTVHYKGSAPARQDLMTGLVDFLYDGVSTSGPIVKVGKMKALAVSGARRAPLLPEVPTFEELGYGNLALTNWFGFSVKAGTPKETIAKLHGELVKVINDPETKRLIVETSNEVATDSSPAEFEKFIASESVRWGKIVRQAGITAE